MFAYRHIPTLTRFYSARGCAIAAGTVAATVLLSELHRAIGGDPEYALSRHLGATVTAAFFAFLYATIPVVVASVMLSVMLVSFCPLRQIKGLRVAASTLIGLGMTVALLLVPDRAPEPFYFAAILLLGAWTGGLSGWSIPPLRENRHAMDEGAAHLEEGECVLLSNRFGTVTSKRILYQSGRGWILRGTRKDIPLKHLPSATFEVGREVMIGVCLAAFGVAMLVGGGPAAKTVGLILVVQAVLEFWGIPGIQFAARGQPLNPAKGLPWTWRDAKSFVDAVEAQRRAFIKSPRPMSALTMAAYPLDRNHARSVAAEIREALPRSGADQESVAYMEALAGRLERYSITSADQPATRELGVDLYTGQSWLSSMDSSKDFEEAIDLLRKANSGYSVRWSLSGHLKWKLWIVALGCIYILLRIVENHFA